MKLNKMEILAKVFKTDVKDIKKASVFDDLYKVNGFYVKFENGTMVVYDQETRFRDMEEMSKQLDRVESKIEDVQSSLAMLLMRKKLGEHNG